MSEDRTLEPSWYYLLLSMWNRTGGGPGISSEEAIAFASLSQNPFSLPLPDISTDIGTEGLFSQGNSAGAGLPQLAFEAGLLNDLPPGQQKQDALESTLFLLSPGAGIPGTPGAPGTSLSVSDEGVLLTAAATSMNFVGATVTATAVGSAVTITVTGGAAGGPAFHPGFATGQFYTSPLFNGVTPVNIFSGTLYALPFFVPVATTFTKISVAITTLDAGKLIELGIYANANGQPTTLEYDCGNVSTSATGDIGLTGLSLALSAGWHWLVCATNSIATVQINGTFSTSSIIGTLLGFQTTNTITTGLKAAWVFAAGALPGTFPTISYVTNTTHPLVYLRL